jgi:glycosyltransferase involved in cell wall biosynthesis
MNGGKSMAVGSFGGMKSNMITLSLCMIVKNEESNLERCLSSVEGIFDEIIIVDTGSTDKTVEIAGRYTDKIYYFEWINDFSAARNYSFSQATMDYIMWLDADDVVTEENKQKLIRLKSEIDDNVTYVFLKYNYTYNEYGGVENVINRERIVKRAENFQWEGMIYENIQVSGSNYLMPNISIEHKHKSQSENDTTMKRNIEILKETESLGKVGIRELNLMVLFYYQTGEYQKCIDAFNKMLDTIEFKTNMFSHMDAFLTVHAIFLELGDYETAYNVLVDYENRFKDKSEYYTTLGMFYQEIRNDTAKAIEYFSVALLCNGYEHTGVMLSRNEAYYHFKPLIALASLLVMLKHYDEALVCANKALLCSPNNTVALNTIENINRLKSDNGGN